MPMMYLQGVGRVPCKHAYELVPGDETIWHHGYRHRVVRLERAGNGNVNLVLQPKSGDQFGRRVPRTRMVGIVPPKKE